MKFLGATKAGFLGGQLNSVFGDMLDKESMSIPCLFYL